MPTPPSISEQLARQAVVPMESTIPPDMTLAQWRRRDRRNQNIFAQRPIAKLGQDIQIDLGPGTPVVLNKALGDACPLRNGANWVEPRRAGDL